MNLSNANTDGSHWVSIFIDFTDNSIIYFDSIGNLPSKIILNGDLVKEL